MIYKLNYFLLTSGLCAPSILLGAFIEEYTDANTVEVGALFMIMPFLYLITRPIICSYADRRQAHKNYMIWFILLIAISYTPYIVIPIIGESFYVEHARISWYIMFVCKIFGDVAMGGVHSILDSCAINYARRVDQDFSTNRIWGTVSWIMFGLIVGQINEIWFLPKYIPAFIILVGCCLLDALLIWLWPDDYFKMLTEEEIERESQERKLKYPNEKTGGLLSNKSLMPGDVVWAHAKGKLLSLVPFCRSTETQLESSSSSLSSPEKRLPEINNKNQLDQEKISSPPLLQQHQQSTAIATTTLSTNTKTTIVDYNSEDYNNNNNNNKGNGSQDQDDDEIKKMTQFKTLLVLIKNDIRILGYSMIFIFAGLHTVSTNFFFMSLSDICNKQRLCNYSQLGGILQASMSSVESIMFLSMKRIQGAVGRVNLAAFCLFLLTIKFAIYGTIWYSINPYWSILVEVVQGITWTVFMTQQVETAHMFSNEVEHILPKLKQKQIITNDTQVEKIKLSLSATMQAIMGNAEKGIGMGFGALIFGIFIEKYSYKELWLVLAILFGITTIITIGVNLSCHLFNIEVGLKKTATMKSELDNLEIGKKTTGMERKQVDKIESMFEFDKKSNPVNA